MEVTGLVINSHVQPPRQWRNKVRMVFFQATKHPEEFEDRFDELNGYVGTEPPRVYRRVKLSKDEPYDTTQTYPVLYG